MKKITDERLKLKNLENIRITFIVQTLGILGILGYDVITKGWDSMKENPLYFVFSISILVSIFLSMRISVEHESQEKSPNRGFLISLAVLITISIVIGILTSISEGSTATNGIITAVIIFVCGFIPVFYIFRLRKKAKDD